MQLSGFATISRASCSEGGKVRVGVALTVPGCPLRNKIRDYVVAEVGRIPGVEEVEVDLSAMTTPSGRPWASGCGGRWPATGACPSGEQVSLWAEQGGQFPGVLQGESLGVVVEVGEDVPALRPPARDSL